MATFFGIWPPDVPMPPASGAAVLLWGNNSIQAGAGIRYMTPGYSGDSGSPTPIAYRVPRDGVLGSMRVRQNNPNGNGNATNYRVLINGAPSGLIVTMASTDTDGSDLANTAPVSAGDLLVLEADKPLSLGSSPGDITVSVGFM